MKRITLTANYLSTICWVNHTIVDWASAGQQYFLDGAQKQLANNHYSFNFDGSITSHDGQYAFIYKKLGTKGLLLKHGEIIREINRSYYWAGAYEYPAAFVNHQNKTYLVHCPLEYCRLDFEDVETGKIVTDIPGRKPWDIFHSRLEINPSNTFLMSKGWQWHPLDVVQVFNIADCLNNPLLLDVPGLEANIGVEICTASFITDTKVLIGSTDEVYNEDITGQPTKSVGIWDMESNQISGCAKVNSAFGNLYAIDQNFAWDTFLYPKIINIRTGDIVDAKKTIRSGTQRSSIISEKNIVHMAFSLETRQLAIKGKDKIEILTPDNLNSLL